MQSSTAVQGIHHITAITVSAAENLKFMEQVLGLRLVKQTVNFDDPFTYHLYYGDRHGAPGTIITFFPWENAPPGRPGAGTICSIALAIPNEAIDHWRNRLQNHGLQVATLLRFDEPVLQFTAPDKIQYELVATARPSSDRSEKDNEAATSITGLHSVTALASTIDNTADLLTDVLGLQYFGKEHGRHRFSLQSTDGRRQYYDLLVPQDFPPALEGHGTVHHIAFRCRSDEEQRNWHNKLLGEGYSVSPVRDRKYFHSIYFREPAGVLFEIATDGPGFAVDESYHKLGTHLQLPGEYEAMRSEISKRLPPLRAQADVHTYVHAYVEPTRANATRTFAAFHGTGGDEHDLLPLVKSIDPDAAIISPRGQVSEHGMNRFFRRLAPGVFDEDDIRDRCHELHTFLRQAAVHHQLDSNHLFALGYSNGANIAAALILLFPHLFSGATLLRPMLPLAQPEYVDLSGKQILILQGTDDRVIPARSTEQLITIFRKFGAKVDVAGIETGHNITQMDIETAQGWLAEL